nr:EOG090X07H9 [Macrothrix elegans]
MATSTLGSAWLVTEDGNYLNKKRKRIVKHKKKAWRVTPIEDVERYLERQRLDERLGGPIEEIASENIFVVDTSTTGKSLQPEPVKHRKSRDIGPLKCFAILNPSSAVTDPIAKRNHVRRAEERDLLVKKIVEKRIADGKIPIKLAQSLKDRQKSKEQRAKKGKASKLRTKFDFDLWGEKGETILIGDQEVVATDLSEEVKRYTLEKTSSRIYSRPDTLFKKTTALPAIEPPHPGISYNPTFEDHQALLQKISITEAKEMKQEKKLERSVKPLLNKISPKEQEVQWMNEMAQGLAEEEEANEDDADEVKLVRQPKPKTSKQKVKAKILKLKEMRRLQMKALKKRMMEVNRLKSLKREIKKEQELTSKRIEKREKIKKAKLYKPAALGPHKYEAPPMEVNFSDEITGNLRSIKADGNILIDRYKSLQRRNIIEPRLRHIAQRRYKLKVFKRKSAGEPLEQPLSRLNT